MTISVCEVGNCMKGSRIRNPVQLPRETRLDMLLEEVLEKLRKV